MRLTGLALESYRCFDEIEVSFDPGVTVIHGANGAGKTTLLESILFGLYGSRALEDATLADVVTRGADAALVGLGFVHAGGEYELEREVAVGDDRASTRRCTLTEPDGERYEGASTVSSRITELLRMDGEAFVNSAYVKQGEINKLLLASPGERQSMIDELLQLGRLEAYRDRADEARLAVRALARERGERIDELQAHRDRLRDPDPFERLNELETELERVTARVSELQSRREELAERRAALEAREAAVTEQHEELEALHERRRELEGSLEELEERRTAIRERLSTLRRERREATDTLEERLDELGLDDRDALAAGGAEVDDAIEALEATIEDRRTAVEDARERAAEARERRAAIDERIEELRADRAELTEQLESDGTVLTERQGERAAAMERVEAAVADLEIAETDREPIEAHREDLTARLDALRADRREVRDRHAALVEHVEQAEALAAEDKCPTCGQPVEASPHVDRLDEDREALEETAARLEALGEEIEAFEAELVTVETAIEALDQAERLDELIADRRSIIEERRDRLDDLEAAIEAAIDERERVAEAVEAEAETIDAAREAIAEANERLQTLRERRDRLTAATEVAERIEERTEAIDRVEERRAHVDELETERQEQLADVDARLTALEAEVEATGLEELADELASVEESLSTLDASLTESRGRRDELTEAAGSVRSDIERLEEVEERLASARELRDDLDGLRDETVDLGRLYETVRADLRERNVATLERLLNETFELLYRNDAYDRIDLGQDYTLAIRSKEGSVLEPAQLSGGERAIFNLSLRCAIYRLLAEGVEGSAPMPPLMLDEPTVFLDQGHVGRLIRLLETMRDFGVEQTLVVSHHEALLDAAEHRIAVEKDPTTNRSTVAELATARPP